jgi:hypothetical protein
LPITFTKTPAIFHVLAAAITATWFLSWLTFKLDLYRIPVLMTIVTSIICLRAVVPAGHVYPLSPWPNAPPLAATAALNGVMKSRGDVLVVVAASGGGITASVWATHVLAELDRNRDIQPSFGDRLSAISGVSGGAVGTLFYLDAFAGGTVPHDTVLDEVVKHSAMSSLGATGWGLVYADGLRLFGLGWLEGRIDPGGPWSRLGVRG